jgi:hypothetical protein
VLILKNLRLKRGRKIEEREGSIAVSRKFA